MSIVVQLPCVTAQQFQIQSQICQVFDIILANNQSCIRKFSKFALYLET